MGRAGGREGGRVEKFCHAHTLPSSLPPSLPQVVVIVIDSFALPFWQDKVFQTESAVAKARVCLTTPSLPPSLPSSGGRHCD